MKRLFMLLFASVLINCSSTSETTSSSSKLVISPSALTLLDVIAGKFPGVKVIGDNIANYLDFHQNTLTSTSPKILIRGGSLDPCPSYPWGNSKTIPFDVFHLSSPQSRWSIYLY